MWPLALGHTTPTTCFFIASSLRRTQSRVHQQNLGGLSNPSRLQPEKVASETAITPVKGSNSSEHCASRLETTGCCEVFTRSKSGYSGRSPSFRHRHRVHSRSPCSDDSIPESALDAYACRAVLPFQFNSSDVEPVRQIIWRLDAPHLANASDETPPTISRAAKITHPRNANDSEFRLVAATSCGTTEGIFRGWDKQKKTEPVRRYVTA